MIVIRKERTTDYNAVREITDFHLIEDLRKSRSFIPELSLVADCDNKVIGYLLFVEVDIGGYKELLLSHIAVHPDFQKQGIARLLINGAHDKARELGYHFAVANGEAVFFKKFGYVPAATYDIDQPVFEKEKGVYMAKYLNFTELPIFGTPVYPDEYNITGTKSGDTKPAENKIREKNKINVSKEQDENVIKSVKVKMKEVKNMSSATPHNEAEFGMIAGTVIMPGDPLRAKYIAENYLSGAAQFNAVRNMFGYTGLYNGKRVSVMGSGMGMPSMGIYSYELYNNYDVDTIIRVGSAGGLLDDIDLRDVIIAQAACTDSNYVYQYDLPGNYAPIGDFDLICDAAEVARKEKKKVRVGNVASTDIFYNKYPDVNKKWASMGVLCIEMETAALYMNAAAAQKKALSILTISDHLFKEGELSSKERETGFNDMIKIALELV